MIELAALALSGLLQMSLPARPRIEVAWPRLILASWAPVASPAYRPEDKSVTSWRDGTRRTLEPAPLAIAAAAFDLGRPVVTRCVKLNNPWCIKRARWPGEIGSDEEGHTAFASTEAGADAAATLLRTYYVSLGRKSALDIVRRWAPAECRIGINGVSAALAVGGLANTLRARFLATRFRVTVGSVPAAGSARARGGGKPRPAAAPRVRVSVVPLPSMPSFRAPDLIAGQGERARPAAVARRPAAAPPAQQRPVAAKAKALPGRVAAKPAVPAAPQAPRVRLASLPGAIPPLSGAGCGSEEGRILSYANAIARALGVPAGSDLKLFDEAGQPTVNLLPVMVAMSAVELGYLHAGPELAEGAVLRLKARLAENAAREAAREQNNLADTNGQ